MKKFVALVIVTSMISFIICLTYNRRMDQAYALVIGYPILYGIFASVLCNMLDNQSSGGRITVSVYLILQWLRNVLFPAVAVPSGYLASCYANNSGITSLATVLCLYELLSTMLLSFCILHFSKRKGSDKECTYFLSGNWYVYLSFILVSIVLFFLLERDMYSFLRLDLTGASVALEADKGARPTRAFVNSGLTFALVLIVYSLYKRYRKTHERKYVWICLVVCMLRLCVISADSSGRISVLYTLGAFLFILPRLFPEYKKLLSRGVIAVAVVVISLLTVYKTFHAFLYSSYSEAFVNNTEEMDSHLVASLINANFYGVRTVAQNLYYGQSINLTFDNYFADIIENIFGLKYLLPTKALTTSALYNISVYRGHETSGYLFSSIAYGTVYYTYFLCPFAPIINMLIAVFIENRLYVIRRIDILFIICMVYVRFAATVFACLPLALNYCSRTLMIGFAVVGCASLFARKNE